MNKLAKEINSLLLENPSIQEYLKLKKEIENDSNLIKIRDKLDLLRKKTCKDDKVFTEEYYDLLAQYKLDSRVKRYEKLNKEIKDLFLDITDILSLK